MLTTLAELLLLYVLFTPALACWVVADTARRGVIRIPPVVVRGIHATYLALIAAPIGFVALFVLLLARAWVLKGGAPEAGHLDTQHLFDWKVASPHPLEMPVHAWTVLVLLFLSHVAVLGVIGLWPILRVERGESLRKIVRVFVPGYVLVWAVMLSQPAYLYDWFLASMVD